MYQGQKSEKTFRGRRLELTPFAGIDGEREFYLAQMGVGIFGKDISYFWGLVSPREIITSYRAMKIVEELSEMDEGDLCRSWCSGRRNPSKCDIEKYVKPIESRIGKEKREEILNMIPPNLDLVIRRLQEKEIDISMHDIVEEIERGMLIPTPFMNNLITDYKGGMARLSRERESGDRILT